MESEHDRAATPLGIFDHAHSYASIATAALAAWDKAECRHPEVPIGVLYAHAIELYLASFLLSLGLAQAAPGRPGPGSHAQALLDRAVQSGLLVPDHVTEVVRLIQIAASKPCAGPGGAGTGYDIPLEALHAACEILHQGIAPGLPRRRGVARLPRLA
ncbi:hypothetical protein [Roseivivax sp. CAU 1761]